MTIEREGRTGPFVISCNKCSETHECLGEDFSEALADAKEEGFIALYEEGEWIHLCEDCK